jgi:hypothetical protein
VPVSTARSRVKSISFSIASVACCACSKPHRQWRNLAARSCESSRCGISASCRSYSMSRFAGAQLRRCRRDRVSQAEQQQDIAAGRGLASQRQDS